MGQLGDLSPEASVVVGILVGLLSTSIQSLGLTLQRKSHLLEDEKDVYDEVKRPPYKRLRWQLGMGMFILSNLVGSTIQITTLPLPVLSTLQASGLVFNTAFATLLLKEPFTRFSLIGTVLTCTGAALIATFGAIAEPAHSLPQLIDLLVRKQFVIWMVSTFLVAIGTLLVARYYTYHAKTVHESRHHPKHERSPVASRSKSQRRSLSNLSYGVQRRASRLRLLRGLAYALVSGILSAHSLLVAKSAVELLVRTIIDHVNQFNSYQSWLILLALVFFALSQLYYLHLGLRLCSTSVLYPFVFCIYNIIAILDGLIYFRQTSRLSVLHACLIALGTVILLCGVLALSWRLDDTTSKEPQATPLGPGLGLVTSPSEHQGHSPSSPLLPTSRPRSSTFKQANTSPMDESTPLLSHHRRRPTVLIRPPPPEPSNTEQIWAELDDSGMADQDVLASLPHSVSPLMSASSMGLKSQNRSRGNSLSSSGISPGNLGPSRGFWSKALTIGKRSTSGGGESSSGRVHFRTPRRAQTLKERTHNRANGARSSSAASTPRRGLTRCQDQVALPAGTASESNLPGEINSRMRVDSPASQRRFVSGAAGGHVSYPDRIRGSRPRSATEAPRPPIVPSRWDMSWSNLTGWRPAWAGVSGHHDGQGHAPRRPEEEGGREDESSPTTPTNDHG